MLTKLNKRLESLAYKVTKPFCYHCYAVAPNGTCTSCGSDDLQRLLPGIGNDWHVDFVIEHLLEEHLSPINVDEEFEECIASCYSETTVVGFLTIDTVTAMKELDPIAWGLARDEHIDGLESDGEIVSFDNGRSYYRVTDIEQFLDEQEAELGEAS